MTTNKTSYDVIVIGGGPSGATAATLVAQQGFSVLLAERSVEPMFKIGESLMPATYWTFERLRMLDKMKASHFPKKYSVQFFSSSGKASVPFYFFENDPHESSQTWQVLRTEFDQMMLDNAAEQGVEVRRGLAVAKILSEGDRAVGVELKEEGGPRRITSKVVIDASGQSSALGRSLGQVTIDPQLRNVAVFSHFQGALRDPGLDEGATLVINTQDKKGWFWYIPLPDDVVSVGVVGKMDHLVRGQDINPQEIFDRAVAGCTAIQPRLAGAHQAWPMKVVRDFSYRSRQVAGEGWVKVGDAFGFIDPLYSSGVFLALKSGELAADAVLDAFATNDFSGARLGAWGAEFVTGMEAIKRLVYAFYTPGFSFAQFLRRFPEHRRAVINLLIGNVYRESIGNIFESMSEMIDLPEPLPFEASELVGATAG